jgi:phosphatidylglycerol:prolipoprotein diacylglycerol transferase
VLPELLRIPFPFFGSLPVYTFGFFMLCCFLGAMRLLENCLEEVRLDPGIAEPLITWAAIGGILGARLLSIVSNLEALLYDPIGTIFSSSGFVFYGGFIGGFLGVYFVLKRNKLSPLALSDVVAAPLAFGYGLGRIGCQISGDGDYGSASSLPWSMNYLYGVVPTSELVHPTPVYESIGAFLLTWLLVSPGIRKKLTLQGQLFGLYLLVSALFRYKVEFLRIEPVILAGLTQAQVISVVIFLFGLYFLFPVRKRSLSLFANPMKKSGV